MAKPMKKLLIVAVMVALAVMVSIVKTGFWFLGVSVALTLVVSTVLLLLLMKQIDGSSKRVFVSSNH